MRMIGKVLLAVIGLALALWCLDRAVVGQGWPRFHRYALTRPDPNTTLDMIKDAKTGICRLVYIAHMQEASGHYRYGATVSVTYLGEVPCDPAPVPPAKGDAPAASVIK